MIPTSRRWVVVTLPLILAYGCASADVPAEVIKLGHCESRYARPDTVVSCLVAKGWDIAAATDLAFFLHDRLDSRGAAADRARLDTPRVSAATAALLEGRSVTVVDSVVGVVLGDRRKPFEILLGVDSAAAPLRLTVTWKRLARYPVLKWRHGLLAAEGTVMMVGGRATIVLDAEGQARIVRRELRD